MKALILSPIGQRGVVLVCATLWLSSILAREFSAWTVVVMAVTVPLWTWVDLYRLVPRNLIIRRTLKFIPYAIPVATFGIDLRTTWLAFLLCTGAALLYLALTLRTIREALHPVLLAMMPKASLSENISETIFYSGSAVAQEYVHRFVLVDFLTSLGVPGALIVAITTASFVLEHLVGRDGGHTAVTRHNLILWGALGVVNGTAAVFFPPALLSCMIAHLLINAPASIRPYLRGRGRSVESV